MLEHYKWAIGSFQSSLSKNTHLKNKLESITVSKKEKGNKMKAEINIDTLSKINSFVSICSTLNCKVDLTDGSGYRVSASSLIGAIATMDWSQVFVECDRDIYSYIQEFITP